MFEQFTESEERGQVGIGTLIVFIALVLVAAIAAGVLINTAGFLQTQAQATGEESTEQVSTNLVYLSTTGTVSNSEDGINQFETTVQLGPGSSAIDLNDTTISVFTDDGESEEFDSLAEDGIELEDRSDDEAVLSTASSDDDATATIVFDLTDGDGIDPEDGQFDEGTTVDIVITTAEGTQAENSFIIEDPLDPQLDGNTDPDQADEIRLG
ncbi:flagellin [Natronomonas pharaonis DSM 2160]|uniref:Flagellin n=1 Tax=Natronomonas pharaonis (strain ATCC 35678 / DSM 2160 / CIP 103997 / JCM 8858 / NBRC 14720 / NCIMB 2260 / Gabara) TaxID=348780 RepID=A0A1U7EVR0_NATPD|nr:flagellin [Natronomonas pharaonis]CAI49136.1 flagellin [Natronomonas pharaonis DSM 2160]